MIYAFLIVICCIFAFTAGYLGSVFLREEPRKTKVMFEIMGYVPNCLLYWAVMTAWARASTSEQYKHLTPNSLDWNTVCKFLRKK
jgi:arginine exporter protein ArgO